MGMPRPSALLSGLLKLSLSLVLVAALGCDMGNGDGGYTLPPGLTGPCTDKGDHCNSSADCCGVLMCNDDKVCNDGSCLGAGSHCSKASDCCGSALCINGICDDGLGSCTPDGGHCQTASDCCGTALCTQSICQSASCVGVGSHCSTSSDCCGSAMCNANKVCE